MRISRRRKAKAKETKKEIKIEVFNPIATKNDILLMWDFLNKTDYSIDEFKKLNHKNKNAILKNKNTLEDIVKSIRQELTGKTGKAKMQIKNEIIHPGLIKVNRDYIDPYWHKMLKPMLFNIIYK